MGNAIARLRHGFDVLHEARQVLQLPPEGIDFFRRAVDDHRMFQLHSLAAFETGVRFVGAAAGEIFFSVSRFHFQKSFSTIGSGANWPRSTGN